MRLETEVQVAPKTIKVRALKTLFVPFYGYEGMVRVRGDDELGEGNGQVFELFDREVAVINPVTSQPKKDKKTGKVMFRTLTAETQFAPEHMERLDDDAPLDEEYISSNQALTIKSDELKAAQFPQRRGPGRPRVNPA